MTNVIFTGCSWTAEVFSSGFHPKLDCSYDKWPAIVGKKLGWNVMNVAECGLDNRTMIDYAIHKIIKCKNEGIHVDKVIVALSNWERYYTPYGMMNIAISNQNPEETWQVKYTKPGDDVHLKYFKQRVVRNKAFFDAYGLPNRWSIQMTMSYIFKKILEIIFICDMLDIEIKFWQMIDAIEPVYLPEDSKEYKLYDDKHKYIMELDEFWEIGENHADKFLQWPVFDMLGPEKSIYGQLNEMFKDGSWRISFWDGHPNENTQHIIADLFCKKIK